MERFSPKIEIINHFDELIQQVDIDIDESLEKYNENQVLGELQCFKDTTERIRADYKFNIKYFESCESSVRNKDQTLDLWSESTKVIDYLNQVRMRTLELLRNEQEESVENSSCFNNLINSELTKEEKRSELFAEKFYFQVKIDKIDNNPCLFNLFTFVTDFYMTQSDINLLQKLINTRVTNQNSESDVDLIKKFAKAERKKNEFLSHDSYKILDEKMVLIGLLYKSFCDNLNNHKFPNHVIQVFKLDVSKIELINFGYNIRAVKLNSSLSIDLSKLKCLNLDMRYVLPDSENFKIKGNFKYIIVENLPSLESIWFVLKSAKETSFKNLYALKELTMYAYKIINLQTDLLENLPNIELLHYSNQPIDSIDFLFYKMKKKLSVKRLKKNCYLDHFMNTFCNQIEILIISDSNFEDMAEFFSEYHLQNLLDFSIYHCINRIEKKLFNGLTPKIQKLYINVNGLRKIDHDAFSDLKQLVSINLRCNSIESLDKRTFSGLINLETLDLSFNPLKRLDENIFSDLKNLKKLSLRSNKLEAFDAKSFVGLENLIELDLSDNKLSHFDVRILDNLPRLERIDLSENEMIIINKTEMMNRFKELKIECKLKR